MNEARKLYKIPVNDATTSQPLPLEEFDETVHTSTKLEAKRKVKKKKHEGEFTPIKRRMDNIPDTQEEEETTPKSSKKRKSQDDIREAVE